MLLLFLIATSLSFSANCEVVNDEHFTKCREYFYRGKAPSGLPKDNAVEMCQRYNNRYHYATLYNTNNRIPLYSAYRLDSDTCSGNQPDRRNVWFVEPQLAGGGNTRDMATAGARTNTYMRVQAINKDYRNTNYDRGHLNPNFYQCDDGRTATFTLTNAVPQDPCFNQNMWKEMETTAKNIMKEHCSFHGARRYFVTGAVPTSKKIPSRYNDKEGDEVREYNRVSVPSVMWTAACCDSSSSTYQNDRQKGFSFGYYGDNIPDSWAIPLSVSSLERRLRPMYHSSVLDIFEDPDKCYEHSTRSKQAITILTVPLNKKVADAVLDLSKSSESSMPPAKRRVVLNIDKTLDKASAIVQQDWKFADADLGIQCPRSQADKNRELLAPHGLSMVLSPVHTELSSVEDGIDSPISHFRGKSSSKRKTVETIFSSTLRRYLTKQTPSKTVENKLHKKLIAVPVTDIKANDSTRHSNVEIGDLEAVVMIDDYIVVPSLSKTMSAMGDRCRDDHRCGKHSQSYFWCYTDWKNNWDYCCQDDCKFRGRSYQTCHAGSYEAYCSPRYSRVTVNGKSCRPDHDCGLHGERYFWCYTDKEQSWEYCCEPWHGCLYHNQSYKWCYTSYMKTGNRYQKCHY